MGWPVVLTSSGGIPITEALNGFGTPIETVGDGIGVAVTLVANGGMPVVGAKAIRSDTTLITADATTLTADYSK